MKTLSTFLSVMLIAAISFTGLSNISKENQYTSVRQYNKPKAVTASLPLNGQDQSTTEGVATIVPKDGAVNTTTQMAKDQAIQAAALKAAKSAQIAQDQANQMAADAIAQHEEDEDEDEEERKQEQNQIVILRAQAAKNKATQVSAAQQAQDQAAAKAAQDQVIARRAQSAKAAAAAQAAANKAQAASDQAAKIAAQQQAAAQANILRVNTRTRAS